MKKLALVFAVMAVSSFALANSHKKEAHKKDEHTTETKKMKKDGEHTEAAPAAGEHKEGETH